MRALTDQEKRTVRLGGVALAIGLIIAGGLWSLRHLKTRRAEYQSMLLQAQDIRDEIDLYQDKTKLAQKLMDNFHLDPMTLARTSLVAQASAAIQKAATESGVGAGTIRESTAHGSSKEMVTIQFEGTGQVSSIMTLLYQLERTGVPLVIDSVQITGNPQQPMGAKVNLDIVILDYDQWKNSGGSGA